MATSKEFIQYVLEKVKTDGKVDCKKMFGEYMVYIDEKPILLVCDDTVFVKILPETIGILGDEAEKRYPYDGAKEHFAIDPDDEKFDLIVSVLEKITPPRKPRKASKRG